jgi:cell fate (sporulation/competence/biofilm development) regulator YlbF (YheA/YmcA/DUF963 family)
MAEIQENEGVRAVFEQTQRLGEAIRASAPYTRMQAAEAAPADEAALFNARMDFSRLIRQVNQVLGVAVTGQISEEDAAEWAGCVGECAGCAGCGARSAQEASAP